MEKDTAKAKGRYSFLDKEKSEFLKSNLDRGWYSEFESRWNKRYKNKAISYPHVNHVVVGRSKNFKVLEILIEMAEENKKLRESIDELIND